MKLFIKKNQENSNYRRIMTYQKHEVRSHRKFFQGNSAERCGNFNKVMALIFAEDDIEIEDTGWESRANGKVTVLLKLQNLSALFP